MNRFEKRLGNQLSILLSGSKPILAGDRANQERETDMIPKGGDESFGTFSMVGRCERAGEPGVCVSTATIAVGAVLPPAELDVAIIAVQATTNVTYGIKGLQLVKSGLMPSNASDALLREDEKKEACQSSFLRNISGRFF